jgi:hypothetical protein
MDALCSTRSKRIWWWWHQVLIQFINYVNYIFRHYIAIFKECSWCLLRDVQLRSSR